MCSSSSGVDLLLGRLLGFAIAAFLCRVCIELICARSQTTFSTEESFNGDNRRSVVISISIANESGIEWKRCCQGHFLIILHDHYDCVIFVSVHKSAEKNKVVNTCVYTHWEETLPCYMCCNVL